MNVRCSCVCLCWYRATAILRGKILSFLNPKFSKYCIEFWGGSLGCIWGSTAHIRIREQAGVRRIEGRFYFILIPQWWTSYWSGELIDCQRVWAFINERNSRRSNRLFLFQSDLTLCLQLLEETQTETLSPAAAHHKDFTDSESRRDATDSMWTFNNWFMFH